MFDLSQLPISGSFLVSCALYAGASLVAGQVIAARVIDKSDWAVFCEASLQAGIKAQQRPEPVVPDTRCDTLVGWLHPDVNRLCAQFGNPDLAGPGARVMRETERQIREAENRRLERAAAAAGSTCGCAAALYRREAMVGWGVYAGSARMISTPQVEGMRSGLQQALSAPACAGFDGGLP